MNARELLTELDDKNVKLSIEGGELNIAAPKGVITQELKQCIKKHKDHIIKVLGNAGDNLPALTKIDREGDIPLSFSQQRLWFINQFEGGNDTQYNVPWSFRIVGELDTSALQQTFNAIVQRHEALRTTFQAVDEQAVQFIVSELALDMPIVDVTPNELQTYADEFACQPFDLIKGPLLRVQLLRLAKEEHILLINMHHIVCDGWSLGVLSQEISEIYQAYCGGHKPELPSLPVQYADYARWQRQWLQGDELAQQVNYWQQQLQDAPALLEMPTDRPRPATQSFEGDYHTFSLSKSLTNNLKQLSGKEGTTLFMSLLTAFNILLYRYSGQRDICVGTPIANRRRKEIEGLVGFFVNTLVLRNQIDETASFKQVLQQAKGTALAAYANQDIPFEHLVDILKPERSMSYSPLFQVVFVLQNNETAVPEIPDLTFSPMESRAHTSRFDLTMELTESDGMLSGKLEYNTDLFDRSTIERFASHYQNLLEGIVRNPERRPCELSLLSEVERQQILHGWNDTKTDYPQDKCIHQMFEIQVEQTPNAIAVVYEDQQLTYAELNQKSNQLAHYLIEQGVGPEARVGLCLERSFEMIIGILGILKAGGAYVPIDPDYPQQRIEYLFENSGIIVLLTQEMLLDLVPGKQVEGYLRMGKDWPSAQAVTYFCLDRDWSSVVEYSFKSPNILVSPANLAYVIYTSGSTGQPKGVAVSHQSVNRLVFNTGYLDFSRKHTILQAAPVSFDAATFEIWGSLLHGGRCVLYPERMPTARKLEQIITDAKVDILWVTTGLFNLIIDENPGVIREIQHVLTGGESASNDHIKRANENCPETKIINMYGPTENTTFTTYYPVPNNSGCPLTTIFIGRPIGNTSTYVLDSELNPMPVGAVGELYAGGDGLAREYLNHPALTAEKFVPNPFSASGGERLYKTGDQVRYLYDGNIDFVGRIDHQVKVRGFRIELGEIESALVKQVGVNEAVVLALSRDQASEDKYLVAYIVPETGAGLDGGEFRMAMQSMLPDYMVPSFFVFMDEIPLTPNGKLDRKALPIPDASELKTQEYVAPHTETEKRLVNIWAEVLNLGREEIGVKDDFFELGGHSLMATRVVSHVGKTFDIEIQIRDLFTHKTIQALALSVDELCSGATLAKENMPPLKPIPRGDAISLSFAQQRLWFINQCEGGRDISYNMPWSLRLEGDLDVAALKGAFQSVIQRHESLRTTFRSVEGTSVQVIADELKLDIPVIDALEQDVSKYYVEHAYHIFDLSQSPLIKLALLRLSSRSHILLVNMHHIISDGWSIGVMSGELANLYDAYSQDLEFELPPLPIQYADFAHWQRQWLQGEVLDRQVTYWEKQLEQAPELLELPTDHPRPAIQSYRGTIERFAISKTLSEQLLGLSRQENATLFMVLMATFKVLLHRYTGQADICVGTGVANRRRQELEDLIGFFVNTLVLRDELDAQTSFSELLQQVRATALSAYSHQDVPFEHLVEVLNPERSTSYSPLFQVVLLVQNAAENDWELPNLRLSVMENNIHTTKFDLTFFFTETSEGLLGEVEYSTDLFERTTIQRMVEHYRVLLQSIVCDPKQRLSDLSLLTDSERQQLLLEWNRTDKPYPQNLCIHQLFEMQVEKAPEAVAVVHEGQQLTYFELDQKSNQLANYLIELMVGPEIRVGLCLERSLEMIIGILGILKAGGAYVPIDPDYPPQRLSYILGDAGVDILLTQFALQERLRKEHSERKVVCLDQDWPTINNSTPDKREVPVAPANLAYMIYTSGSTGKPKGTMLSHHGMVNLSLAQRDLFNVTSDSRVIQFASLGFDAATWEWVMALTNGAQLCLIDSDTAKSGELLSERMKQYEVSHATLPPVMLPHLVEKQLPSLSHLVVAGEACPEELAQQWCRGRHFFNAYGPTETTVCASIYPYLETSQHLSIGRPLPNFQLYVLDECLNPVPIGARGELYIGGAGLARGYHGRAALTAEKFIPNPFNGVLGECLYRSGDLVRYLPEGNIQFVGRIDHQVKLRGLRIEMGEIESNLREHAAIQECVVLAREDEPGNKQLVAYLTPDASYEPPDAEASERNTETVDQWQGVFESTYATPLEVDTPFFDYRGWDSTYTGEPIPEDDMREWADTAVDRILALKPNRALEIGCGTGLILGRVVPHCESYVGTDFSEEALSRLQAKLPQLDENADKVTLHAARADNLRSLHGRTFDTVIINSVAQYFPNVDYLIAVLTEAVALLSTEGQIFVGDVRHLGLMETFHTSVQLYNAKDNASSITAIKSLAQYQIANDQELVVAPAFFEAFKAHSSVITHVQVLPKLGNYLNELSKYRYDVVLHKATDLPLIDNISWTSWETDKPTIPDIQRHLAEQPNVYALGRVANARIDEDIRALQLSAGEDETLETVADLKTRLGADVGTGLHPNELVRLATENAYELELSWAAAYPEGVFDVVFHRRVDEEHGPFLAVFPTGKQHVTNLPYRVLANNPQLQDLKRALLPTLRDYLLEKLPDYMAPAFYVFLDKLPLTPNGKIDRKALPRPDVGAQHIEKYIAPETETQKELVAIWGEMLNVPAERIGITANFFDLGGHSLLATRVVSLVRKIFDIEIQIRDLFTAKTVEALALVIDEQTKKRRLAEGLMSEAVADDENMEEIIL